VLVYVLSCAAALMVYLDKVSLRVGRCVHLLQNILLADGGFLLFVPFMQSSVLRSMFSIASLLVH
jgi:hypothetical protein